MSLNYGDKIKITWVHEDAKELYSIGDIKKIVGTAESNRGDYVVDSNKKGHKFSYISNNNNQWSIYRVDYELYEKRSNRRKYKKGDIIYISIIPGYEDYLPEFFIVGAIGIIKRDDGENKSYLVEFKEGRWWIDEDYLQIKKDNKMKRFENAEVGDEVYCRLHGNGIIKSITYSDRYPLECLFCDNCTPFDYDGRSQKDHFEPTLFYRKGEEKYLTERPDPDIDWSKVPQGTKVKVWNTDEEPQDFCTDYFMAYFTELKFSFWTFNDANKLEATGYKYCKLSEPCKPEWRK